MPALMIGYSSRTLIWQHLFSTVTDHSSEWIECLSLWQGGYSQASKRTYDHEAFGRESPARGIIVCTVRKASRYVHVFVAEEFTSNRRRINCGCIAFQLHPGRPGLFASRRSGG